MTDDRKQLRGAVADEVNSQPQELEDWLQTDASTSEGQDAGDGEAIGHDSGRRIVEIERTRVDACTDADYDHMKRVIGYTRRHWAQRPEGEIEESAWRYSLMNWGYDPCKEGGCLGRVWWEWGGGA